MLVKWSDSPLRTGSALATPAQHHTSASGFVLADLELKPVYANVTATRILAYFNDFGEAGGCPDWKTQNQKRLQLILQAKQYTGDLPSLSRFVSGRRLYVCRLFLLDVAEGDTRSPLIALLMERSVSRQAGLLEASRRYHLSPREYETVLHLIHGLTTKEIAQRMNVSPNTVKQFVRLIMSKLSVTTRSGVLGKLLAS